MFRNALIAFSGLFLWAAAAPAQGQYRAFWADGFHSGYKTPAQVDKLVADAQRAGANALFVQMRRRANSFYLKSLEPPVREAGYSPEFDALEDLITKAHAAGLEAHAWFAVSPVGGPAEAAADPRHLLNLHGPSLAGRDNWISLSDTGQPLGASGNYWIDPGHPDAAAYTADVIQHVVRNYAVDGIHLDLVRYSEDTPGNSSWGYNPLSVERFNRLFLRTGRPPSSDAQWSEFRRRQVTALVRKIYLRAVGFRREIRVSAALIPWGDAPAPSASDWPRSSAYTRVFQDWRAWLEEGILDFGVPMNYDRESVAQQRLWFDRWLAFERANQGRRMIVTGIASYLNSISSALAQARRALETPSGAPPLGGVNFYSYAVTDERVNGGAPAALNSEFYAAAGDFFAAMGPAATPVLIWKVVPTRGHILGQVLVTMLQASGEVHSPLADGIRMTAQGPFGTVTTTTDGSGAFGWVDLEFGAYTVTGFRGNTVVIPPASVVVRAGEVTSVSLDLSAAALRAAMPVPNSGGVTNAASYAAAVAPGSLVAIFGTALAETTAAAETQPLPLSLAGTQVLINGLAAPVLYVSPEQINVFAPLGLQGAEARVVVRRNGLESAAVTAPLFEAVPGLFASVLKADYSPVSAQNPAARGDVLLFFGTGFGAVTPEGTTVAAAQVNIGGRPSRVLYSGLAPGFTGLYQLNVEVPSDAVTGDAAPVHVIVAGRAGNSISIPVR